MLRVEGLRVRGLVFQNGRIVEGSKAYRIFVWEVTTMTLTQEVLVYRRLEVNSFFFVDLGCRLI